MTDHQYPLHIFCKVVDDFGVETNLDAFPVHDCMAGAQVGDHVEFKGHLKVEGWDEWPAGTFVVQEREFALRRDAVTKSPTHGANLTLYIRCI